jgi:hypothetical protein
MKKLLLATIFAITSLNSFAYNPKLDPAIKSVNECLSNEGVLLCDSSVTELLKSVDLNVRGEFVLFLKEMLNSNQSSKVVTNLYKELQILVPMYEELDTCSQWSCTNIKQLQDSVSVLYVKVSPIDFNLLVKLYKSATGEVGRYGLLMTLNERISGLTSITEMEDLIKFLEVAKEHSKVIGDESYLYRSCVDLIRQLTVKSIKMRPGHEGIYSLKFDDADAASELRIDRVVVMESNNRDSLVVNFVASKSNIVTISFDSAGILGNTIFSNQDVYNNNQNSANPFFKLELNRETNTIKGIYSTARFGELSFSGKLMVSNLSVFSENTVKGLNVNSLIGTYNVKVGSASMKLIIKKRTDDRALLEAALFNDNAMISFSKVSLNSEKGILSLVDYKNELKLTLGVLDINGLVGFKGQFLNSAISKVFDVESK